MTSQPVKSDTKTDGGGGRPVPAPSTPSSRTGTSCGSIAPTPDAKTTARPASAPASTIGSVARSLLTERSSGANEFRSSLRSSYRIPLCKPPEKLREAALIDEVVDDHVELCIAGSSNWPLVLWGEPGTGKTCVGLCVLDEFGGWYATLEELHQLVLKAGRGELFNSAGTAIPVEGEFSVWHYWRTANVTILDELGKRGTTTDAQYETLTRAIDLREGRPSIVISNLSISELEGAYDARVASRLSVGTVVQMTGDRRLAAEPG